MPGSRSCRVAVVLATALCLAPAAEGATPRIVGGAPVDRPHPYTAHVEMRYADAQGGLTSTVGYCAGTLVAARYVVTAGHCLEDDPARVDVALGVTRVDHDQPMSGGASSIPAENQFLDVDPITHPSFGYTAAGEPQNDVAVLVLPRPAPQEQMRLVRPQETRLWAPGVPGLALGWGRTCNPLDLLCSPSLSDDLRQVAQPIQPDAACEGVYGPSGYTAPTMLCAGGESGRDTCQGDSGGPLLVPDAGAVALAGVTSFGPAGCGTGEPAAYARIGGALNGFVRAHVPQVEIDRDTAEPVPGQGVTFTALPSRPGGGGPFGGYDALSWDLDGDGAFGEAAGQSRAGRTMRPGINTVAVRATSAAGDAEVRRVHVQTVDRSIVGFAARTWRVREGRTARLRLERVGVGAGSVTVRASGGRAFAPSTVAFAEGEESRRAPVRIRDDRRVERAQRLHLRLGDWTGALTPGAVTSATLIVADDDARARVVGRRTVAVGPGGRFAVRVRTDRAGRLRATVRSGGRTLARSGRRARRAGTHVMALRLRAAAPQRARVAVSFRSAKGARRATARRAIRFR